MLKQCARSVRLEPGPGADQTKGVEATELAPFHRDARAQQQQIRKIADLVTIRSSSFGTTARAGRHRLVAGDGRRPDSFERLMRGEHAATTVRR
jgi:hypothetical protein